MTEFSFYHSLVDDDPKLAAPALEALGRIAASWARLEHHIDALIVQVNKPSYDERLFAEHPTSFSKKIELLKRWFNQYPPLSSYTADMRTLTQHMKALSKDDKRTVSRNLLLHAIPASYNAKSETLTLHHMAFEGANIHSRHIDVTLHQLHMFAGLIQMANAYLATITRELFTPEWIERLGKRE
ncbi:hypothetical protein [Hoeflea sp.]|uniref:hypothetical protein n=1 Tax=Hoeflea sp. TaxID=1940281 RepID=UPI0019A56AAA|nr:hypothetical protein [Hoeflea sp.]MBC7279835.1 hypothetical protein [Hoeflea sp.]